MKRVLLAIAFCLSLGCVSKADERDDAVTAFIQAYNDRGEIYERLEQVYEWHLDFTNWWWINRMSYNMTVQTIVYGKLVNASSKISDGYDDTEDGEYWMQLGFYHWNLAVDPVNFEQREYYYGLAEDMFTTANTCYNNAMINYYDAKDFLEEADEAVSDAGPDIGEMPENVAPPFDPNVPESLWAEIT